MTAINHADPTVNTTHTSDSLTVVATGTFDCTDPVVSFRTRIQKPQGEGHVEVHEAKKYPGMGALDAWSNSILGDESLVERELRGIVYRAAIEAFEDEIKTYD